MVWHHAFRIMAEGLGIGGAIRIRWPNIVDVAVSMHRRLKYTHHYTRILTIGTPNTDP